MGQPVRTSLFDDHSDLAGTEVESAEREIVDQEPKEGEKQTDRPTEDVSGVERGKTEGKDEIKYRMEAGKQVVRVMVFYGDDTFKSFEPSQ